MAKGSNVGLWYLYIVENKLGHYYTGISTDIQRRFAEHQSGGAKCAKALKGKGPLQLKFQFVFANHSQALKAEIWVKRLSRSNKQKLLKGDLLIPPIETIDTLVAEKTK